MKKQFSLSFIVIIISVFSIKAQKQITEQKVEILNWLDEFNVILLSPALSALYLSLITHPSILILFELAL